MMQAFAVAVFTFIGGTIGIYFDSPVIGVVIGFFVGLAIVVGAIGELAGCVIDCID